jgi:phage baseplate assembly protein W
MINNTDYRKLYKDIDINMKKNEVTGDVKIKTGAAAVSQSIKNIILTTLGERPFSPRFGYGMYDKLFELDDPVTLGEIKSKISSIINVTEPRARVQTNDVEIINSSNNEISINIKYTLKGPESSTISNQQQLTIVLVGDN